MIKVLHINAGSKVFGGVSSFCLNIYRNIDREQIQFDFLTPDVSTYTQYKEEIQKMGGQIYELGIRASSLNGKFRLWFALKDFLSQHEYDIIHINSGVLLFNCVVAGTCRKASDSVIFVHSHSNGGRSKAKELFSGVLKEYLVKQADVLLACSKSAAEYMFPAQCISNVQIMNNGIMADRFGYSSEIRKRIRDELKLSNKFVIGHVGRFSKEKNHPFLLDLLSKVKKKKDNAVLLLVGDGPQFETIRSLCAQKDLEDSVIFTGTRTDINQIYQSMDVFVLPSLYEGFGIVNIEAQASGLKCVISTAVPAEVNITGNVIQLDLSSPLERWAEEVLKVPKERIDCTELVKACGFDISVTAGRLKDLYTMYTHHVDSCS